MEIREMNMEQLEERLSQIATEKDAEGANLDALMEEVGAINERKAELNAQIEERNAKAEAIAKATEPTTVVREFKENEKMERTFDVDSVEYRNAWLKNLMGKELDAEERTAITGTDAIPTETLNKIIVKLEENPLLGKIDLMQIPGYVKIPVYATNNDASWTDSSTDSQDVIGNITLTPYQLIKTIEVPATVDKMSISAFEAYIVKALANKIESALQKAVIAGTGSSQPEGIITKVTTSVETFTKAAVTKKDLLGIMGGLGASYQNGACWIMPASVFFDEVMNITNHDTFTSVNEGFSYKLFGKDVVLDDNCTVSSVDNILYGNPQCYHMNLGEGIKVDKDMSVGFRSNSAVYRAVCLADGELESEAAFIRATRATS